MATPYELITELCINLFSSCSSKMLLETETLTQFLKNDPDGTENALIPVCCAEANQF